MKKAAALYLENGIVTALKKGKGEDGKVTGKAKAALDNVLNLLSCSYQGLKEEDGYVHPILLKIARDSLPTTVTSSRPEREGDTHEA